MSYKELKAATDEINTKFNTTRKHLSSVLQTLQHKDKELRKLREKMRSNSRENIEVNVEEEKQQDKRLIEYALYLEKQYKLLEEKFKRKSKVM